MDVPQLRLSFILLDIFCMTHRSYISWSFSEGSLFECDMCFGPKFSSSNHGINQITASLPRFSDKKIRN
uniref:Uncharacterized protein n=1 Tax=Arundo donax TaxID=35708 RepID=A0A0A8ZQ34_ARUDO